MTVPVKDRKTRKPGRRPKVYFKQEIFLEHFILNDFSVVKACKAAGGITPGAYRQWCNRDTEDFNDRLAAAVEHKKDLIEKHLLQLIKEGDTAATIFAAKCQLKDRGYIEKTKEQIDTEVNVTFQNSTQSNTVPIQDNEGSTDQKPASESSDADDAGEKPGPLQLIS